MFDVSRNQVSLDNSLARVRTALPAATLEQVKKLVRQYWGVAKALSETQPAYKGVTLMGASYMSYALALLLASYPAGDPRQGVLLRAWEVASGTRNTFGTKDVRFQDVPWQASGDDWAGNAFSCTDYDFTDYDVYGMAMHWWRADRPVLGIAADNQGQYLAVREEPRMLFCGSGRDAPFVGDEPLVSHNVPVTTPDGGMVYQNARESGPYVVGGKPFCRNNPKDWVKERVLELCFLVLLQIQADDYANKVSPTENDWLLLVALQHNFIMRKTLFRNQWVTHIPGFHSHEIRPNNRTEYILCKWRSDPDYQKPAHRQAYVFMPKGRNWGEFMQDGRWRWGLPGAFESVAGDVAAGALTGTYVIGNRPDHVVQPPDDGDCLAEATVLTIIAVIKALYTIYQVGQGGQFAWMSGGTSNADKIEHIIKKVVKFVESEAKESLASGELDITFGDIDFTGAAAAAEAIVAAEHTYTESFRPCAAIAEGKYWVRAGGHRQEMARLWAAAAKEALILESKIDPDQETAPTTTPPGTTPVVAPAPSGGGLLPLLMGAGAGFLVGGPIGAGVGAVVAAAASGGASTSKPEPAAVMSGRWTLKDSTGIVQLQQSGSTVTGGIAWSAGRGISLRGTRTGNTLEGTWADVSNKSNTGRFKLVFSGDTFTGPWGSGAASQGGGVWTGQRG